MHSRRRLILGTLAVLVVVGGLVGLGVLTGNPTHRLTLTTPSAVCGNSSLNGPSSAPGGATTVNTQTKVNNITGTTLPTNTTYWINGSFTLTGQIFPNTGDVFEGAPGATLLGGATSGSASNETAAFVDAAFGPYSSSVSSITIEYLTIENFAPPTSGAAVNVNAGASWTVSNDTIAYNSPGSAVMIGTDDIVNNDCLTENGQYAFDGYLAPGTTGDPVDTLTNGPTDVTLTNNEISYNDTCDYEVYQPFPFDVLPPTSCGWTSVNGSTFTGTPATGVEYSGCGCAGGGKFWETDGSTVTGNYVHDNEQVGLWWDTNDNASNISNNYISDNFAEGIQYEAAYNANIENNTFVGDDVGLGVCAIAASGNSSNGCDVEGFALGAIYISESGYDPNVSDSANPGFTQTQFAITGNTFDDNWSNVVLWENPNRFCGSSAEPNDTSHCVLGNPTSYNEGCTGSYCPFSAQAPPCDLTIGCSGTNWPGTCGTYAPSSSVDAGTATTSTALLAATPTSTIFTACRWSTKNVYVADNTFELDADSGGCNQSDSGPGCMPTTCTSANNCGESAIMSTSGITAPYSGSYATAIETAITTTQGNLFCGNTYSGGGTPLFMYPSQGTVISKSTWITDGQDASSCGGGGGGGSGHEPPISTCTTTSSGGPCYTPPATTGSVTPGGTVQIPIDPDGCTDNVDSTVALQDWINGLPDGTQSTPTIVEFPQSACYLVNGTLWFWGLTWTDFSGGEFRQKTVANGEETAACVTTSPDDDAASVCLGQQVEVPDVTYTSGSSTLTDNNGSFPSGIYVGMGIDDLNSNAVPSGTTVSSVSGSTLTMSANAAHSKTPVTNTGTSLTSGSSTVSVTSATGITTNMGVTDLTNAFAVPPGTTVSSISGTTITLSTPLAGTEGSDTLVFDDLLGAGYYTNTLADPTQVRCNAAGTGASGSSYTDPDQEEQDHDVAQDYYDFTFWFEGGCNDVVRDMTIVGANDTGGAGGNEEQDSFITFAGAEYDLVYDVTMDGPDGDCVTSQGLTEAAGGGGSYPANNITAENNTCVNAGRDDMSVIEADEINYSNNLLYWGADDIFDVEYDAVCQYGAQNNLDFTDNTVENSLEGPGSTFFTAQTDSPLENINVSGNTVAGSASIIVKNFDTTWPTQSISSVTTTSGSPTISVSGGFSSLGLSSYAGGQNQAISDSLGYIPSGTELSSGGGGATITMSKNATGNSTAGDTVSFNNTYCPEPPTTSAGSSLTIADNTWTGPNTASGGSPMILDFGVSPMYVYGNNGPTENADNFVTTTNISHDPTCNAASDCPAIVTGEVEGNVIGSCSTCTILAANGASGNLTDCGNAETQSLFNAGTFLDSACPNPNTGLVVPTLPAFGSGGATTISSVLQQPINTALPNGYSIGTPQVITEGTLPCTPGNDNLMSCVT